MIAIHKETGEVIRMADEVRAADGRGFQWSQLIFHPEPVDEFKVTKRKNFISKHIKPFTTK